ncbi:MAG: DUF4931 domain-containing protein, partial [archaeon]
MTSLQNEFRIDPITGTVVIFSPKRGARPSDYLDKKPEIISGTACPLCPGNEQMTPPTILFKGASAQEWTIRNFENKFAALDKGAKLKWEKTPFGQVSPAYGRHEVVVETNRHGAAPWELSEGEIAEVFKVFSERFSAISKDRKIESVLIFQNHGKDAGASLSHLHAQIAAFPFVISGFEKRIKGSAPKGKNKKCKYCEIADKERELGIRTVFESENILVLCPFASVFKYETMVLPKKHLKGFPDFAEIGQVLKRLFVAYNKLLG